MRPSKPPSSEPECIETGNWYSEYRCPECKATWVQNDDAPWHEHKCPARPTSNPKLSELIRRVYTEAWEDGYASRNAEACGEPGWSRLDAWMESDAKRAADVAAPVPSNPLPGCMIGPSEPCEAFAAQAREIERLREAIYWALGERDEFPDEPEPLAGKYRRRYHWRTELRRRAFGAADVANGFTNVIAKDDTGCDAN